MKRATILLASIVSALALVAHAQAVPRTALRVGSAHAQATLLPALHVGSHDTRTSHRVHDLQWLLGSNKPSVFHGGIKGTFPYAANGLFGKRTAAALVAYKFRLGYPRAGQCGSRSDLVKPVAGAYFFALHLGQTRRPLCWIALAQRRAKPVRPGPTHLAQRIIAFEARQIGTREQCGGLCNRGWLKGPGGYSVDDFEARFGLRGLQWCGIFQRFSWKHEGADFAPAPYNPYYVPSIVQWGLAHGYVSARVRVGSLIVFLASRSTVSAHHVGMVVRIVRSGYYTIEGNSGDAARRHYYEFGSALRIFVNVPGVA